MIAVPPQVERAERLATGCGVRPCARGDGRLLHVLAGRRGLVRTGAAGTAGVTGAAWLVSALDPSVPFVAVEADATRAGLARDLFSADAGVRVLLGEWRQLLPPEAPFDLLLVDALDARGDPWAVAGLLAPGGTAVVFGVAAGAPQPEGGLGAWLEHPWLRAASVAAGGEGDVLVAVRAL